MQTTQADVAQILARFGTTQRIAATVLCNCNPEGKFYVSIGISAGIYSTYFYRAEQGM
jgi:hypothetical protein